MQSNEGSILGCPNVSAHVPPQIFILLQDLLLHSVPSFISRQGPWLLPGSSRASTAHRVCWGRGLLGALCQNPDLLQPSHSFLFFSRVAAILTTALAAPFFSPDSLICTVKPSLDFAIFCKHHKNSQSRNSSVLSQASVWAQLFMNHTGHRSNDAPRGLIS